MAIQSNSLDLYKYFESSYRRHTLQYHNKGKVGQGPAVLQQVRDG